MSDKIKAKIEAMAESKHPYDDVNRDRQGFINYRIFVDGATPWAEWCARFGETIRSVVSEDGEVDLCLAETLNELLQEYEEFINKKV